MATPTPLPSPIRNELDACLDRASGFSSRLANELDYLKGLTRDIETHREAGLILVCCESVKSDVASIVKDVAEIPGLAARALEAA